MLGDRRRLQKSSFMKVSLWSGCLSLYWQTGKSFASLRPLVTPWCSFLVSSGRLFALASTFSFKISQLLFRVLWIQPPSGGGELEHPFCLLHASTHTPPISTRKRGQAQNYTRWWIHIGVSVLRQNNEQARFWWDTPKASDGEEHFFWKALQCSVKSVQSLIMSDSLWPHGLQHARLTCPSPTPRAYSNSCPLSHWCHPTISCSVVPFLFPPSIFPSISVFSNELVLCVRWPKYWTFNFSISPSNEYSGLISFRIDWFDLLAVQGTFQESSPTPQFKSIKFSALSFLYSPTLTSIHDYWKTHSLD